MNYIDNKEFYASIVERKQLLKECQEQNKPVPKISRYLSECIILIATNLVNKPNFFNYSFKEELIGDGIENCILYFDKFDIEKSTNPFSYFTQVVFFAFLRRIQKEKKQYHIKHKIIQSVDLEELELQAQDLDSEYKNSYREFLKELSNVTLPKEPEKIKKLLEEPDGPLGALFI